MSESINSGIRGRDSEPARYSLLLPLPIDKFKGCRHPSPLPAPGMPSKGKGRRRRAANAVESAQGLLKKGKVCLPSRVHAARCRGFRCRHCMCTQLAACRHACIVRGDHN